MPLAIAKGFISFASPLPRAARRNPLPWLDGSPLPPLPLPLPPPLLAASPPPPWALPLPLGLPQTRHRRRGAAGGVDVPRRSLPSSPCPRYARALVGGGSLLPPWGPWPCPLPPCCPLHPRWPPPSAPPSASHPPPPALWSGVVFSSSIRLRRYLHGGGVALRSLRSRCSAAAVCTRTQPHTHTDRLRPLPPRRRRRPALAALALLRRRRLHLHSHTLTHALTHRTSHPINPMGTSLRTHPSRARRAHKLFNHN